ncbi:related to nicotinamide mononucleotide permease [Melanopsichium pennsylvanicum]|uniref:Related to nicotinamide mononucleotide permease n=2 Tax=Melanopsichium pennsylvanicum TaxID=63383 RepID=A0AAJ4XFZ2_9BASI|nr:related to nicotinamide mononucleotide permease [Melanopsichium pennsylvanicum 4]SNX81423.1 related to nicotinamide mononucleotide permease [Melanopsichium pennsylvanicum]
MSSDTKSKAVHPTEHPITTFVGSSAPSENAHENACLSKLTKWWTDEEEACVRKKLDRRIVTTSFFLYFCALLDRSNIGNAKTAGMERALHMSDSKFQWLLTIFYIAYIIFQFQVLMYKLLPPRIWMSLCVFVWGVAGVCQAATRNWEGMMAARFWLGVSEAGYGTGFALYLSFFYPRTEIGLRFGWFVSAGAISAAVAGSIAYGLVHVHSSLQSWRLLFLIEGLPTIVMAPITYLMLPNSIQYASFLSTREKAIAEARLFRPPPPEAVDIAKGDGGHSIGGLVQRVDWSKAASAFTDPMSYISAILLFVINVGYSSVPVYVPTLISEMGYGSIKAQGLSAPPYVLAFVLSLVFCWLTDRYQIRGPVCTALLIVGAIGYLMLATLRSTAARYIGVWLIINGLFPFIPILYMWLLGNQVNESKKGLGLVIFATIGQCGPLLGTHLFPANEKPYYVKGTAVSAALLVFGIIVSAVSSYMFWNINRRRDGEDAMSNFSVNTDIGERKNDEEENNDILNATSMSEADRRKIDILLRGEESPYFRFII